MRNIKFNIYDTHLKQYVTKGIDILGEFMLLGGLDVYMNDNPNPNYKYSLQRLNDFEFLQYTGLKDCNGVEIYEGDIVKDIGNFKKEVNVRKVVFKAECFGFVLNEEDEYFNYSFNYNKDYVCLNVEVIGNIYESDTTTE